MKKIVYSALLISALFACKKKESENPAPIVTPTPVAETPFSENKYVRLLVTDAANSNLYFIDGHSYKIETITDFPHSGARAYATYGGRFAGIVSGSGNFVKFWDSGIEAPSGTFVAAGLPKWGKTVSNGLSPVHFYSKGNTTVLFNDGDGSLSVFREDELHSLATASNLSAGNTAHHGAPVVFSNGKIAITHKATQNPVAGVLPELVKVINADGSLAHDTVIRTGGIHGEASDGVTSLFGSTSGVLKVKDDGSQELISFPSSFGTVWLGSYYYGKASNVFVGFRRGFGVYRIDPIAKTVTTITDAKSFNAVNFDEEGKYLIILHNNGKLQVVDPATGSVVKETTSTVGFPTSGSANMPVVSATKKVVYVADAINNKLLTYNKSDLSLVKELALPGKPLTVAIIGFDGN